MNRLIETLLSGVQIDRSGLALRIVLTLAHFLWQGAVVGLVLCFVLRLILNSNRSSKFSAGNASARYWTACVAMGLMPILAATTFCLISTDFNGSGPTVSNDQTSRFPTLVPDENQNGIVKPAISPLARESSNQLGTVQDADRAKSRAVRNPSVAYVPGHGQVGRLSHRLASLAPWLVLIYLSGVTVLMARLAIGLWRTNRLTSRMTPASDSGLLKIVAAQARLLSLNYVPTVGMSDQIIVPIVIRIFKPVILLPVTFTTGLSPDQVELILRHELAHIRRLDPVVNLIQRVIESILFFHPVTWWISRCIRIEREYCCDEIAVDGRRQLQYAGALLQLAQQTSACRRLNISRQLDSMAADGHRRCYLSHRIHRLLGQSYMIPFAGRGSLVAVVLLMVTSITGLAVIGQVSVQQAETEWIRGTCQELEMRIHGDVFDVDGRSVEEFSVAIKVDSKTGSKIIKPPIDGNTFSVWVPVNQDFWGLSVKCESRDGKFLAIKSVSQYSLRSAAMKGMEFLLVPADRQVTVRVVNDGKPVPDAWVKMENTGPENLGKSDREGIVKFSLLPEQSIYAFTAWTDSGQIGGYQFARGPTRDPQAANHEVELFDCRPLKILLINDQDESPVPNANFRIQVATPEPHFNYLGQLDDCTMTSDTNGEATFNRWPDWPAHHVYIESKDRNWVTAGEDVVIVRDVMTVRMKPSAIGKRVTVTGQLNPPTDASAGLAVAFDSFQGEAKDSMDSLVVFADKNGKFVASVLPDATYAAFVLDESCVSNFAATIPYDSSTDQVTMPELKIEPGVPLNLRVTAGTSQRPLINETVSVRSDFSFEFTEDGDKQQGRIMRQVFATTDESGILRAVVPPGPVEAGITIGGWSGEVKAHAEAGRVCNLEIHRPIEGSITTTIALSTVGGQSIDLASSSVAIRSLDKIGRESLDLQTDQQGEVTFSADSSRIAIFAQSADGGFAGVQAVDVGRERLELQLVPTVSFSGRLVDEQRGPVVNQAVELKVEFADTNGQRAFGALANRSTLSDANGNFHFEHLPVHCQISLYTIRDDSHRQLLTRVYLKPDQQRPVEELVLQSSTKTRSAFVAVPIAETFARTLRDARLGNFNLLAISYVHDETVADFVKQNLTDYGENPDCSRFMQFKIPIRENRVMGKEFFDSKAWPMPDQGEIFVCAIDQSGQELERLTVDIADDGADDQLREFMKGVLPPQQDAESKWTEALAEAARSERKVWVRISQRYCAPCFQLSRWLDDQRELIEQDYVLLKIDDMHDINSLQLAKLVTGDRSLGIPFHGIYNSDGTKIIDSFGPVGNIGFPSSYEGKLHLLRMLQCSRKRLTDAQIDDLLESLK